ncbi:LexA family protein [Acinetobacter puyangensis]|uniref:LexA family protein n=1 Tax=Acinetobacter puyangensis TaxID=1096779 RepID=UPI003A4D9F5B
MSTLQERMNLAIDHWENTSGKKFKNTELADYVGTSRANVGLWVNGSAKELEALKCMKAAKFLGVNQYWLAGDDKFSMLVDVVHLDNNVDLSKKISLVGRPVPVISWVAAGSFSGIETVLRDVEVDEYLPPNNECGKNGYGLIVTGNSMLPKFEPEDRLYVNPDFQVSDLKTNDLVIVSCAGDSEATFKKITIEGESKFLEPLNPNWPEKIIKMTEGCRLMGKVVGQYRKW